VLRISSRVTSPNRRGLERINCPSNFGKRGNFYVAVAIVDCHRARARTDGRAIRGLARAVEGLPESGGAFKSGRSKKRPFALRWTCTYACMRSRDTRPLYERYLMDCIGRAQTLNLTFTIIAALREGMYGASRGERYNGTGSTMLDVNFIILAKKLRPGSSSSHRFSFSLSLRPSFIPLSLLRYLLYFYFLLRIFRCCNNSSSSSLAGEFNLAKLCTGNAHCARSSFSLSHVSI